MDRPALLLDQKQGQTTFYETALAAAASGIQLGRVRPRRSARPHEPGDAREGAAGHRRGEGRHYFLPVAAARLSRRQRAQSPQVAAEAGLHAPRGQAKLLLSPRGGKPGLHRRRQRRPGAPHAAVLDAVGLVRAYRQPFRCRRRRRARDRVLQRLSRRRGRQAGAGEPGERAVGEVRGDAGARARYREPRRARRAGPRSAGGFESPLRARAARRHLRRFDENPGEGCCGDRERRYGVPVHRLRGRRPRAEEEPGPEAAARHLQRPRRTRRAAAAVDLGFGARLPDRRQLRRRDHSDEPGEPQAARLDAAARALHLQERHPSWRAVVSDRAGALAARAWPQPLSAHRAAAAPARGRRLAGHADRDGLNSFDYIVVGAGSAGCVLASRLTESGRRSVLLLEAGPRDTDFWIHVPLGYGKLFARTDLNWAYESEPEPALNGRRMPGKDDFTGATQEGTGYYQATESNGRRCSTAVGYLRPAEKRPNLKIEVDALATRIHFRDRRAVGVEFQKKGETHTVRAGEIILCGGAFNSPQLLQLSGVGPRALLERHGIPVVHESPGVGADLQDHFYVRTFWRCRKAITLNDDMMSLRRMALVGLRYFLFRQGPLTVSAGHAAAFIRTRPDLKRPDAQLYFINFSSAKRGGVLHRHSGFTCAVSQLQVESRGSVHIRCGDPAAAPAIRYNYLATENDRRVMIEGLKLVRRIVNTAPMRDYVNAEYLPGPGVQGDSEWLDYCRGMGGTGVHSTFPRRIGAGAGEKLEGKRLGGLGVI